MRWWFCIPGALVPDVVARHAVQTMPRELLRALRHATVIPDAHDAGAPDRPAPHLHWLWQRFGGKGDPVLAPFLAEESIDNTVWCCDPVHFALALDHVVVKPIDAGDDLRTLMQSAAAVARDSQVAVFEHHGQWFLRPASAWQLTTVPLDAVLGRSLTDAWPTGSDARRWRKLASDIQIEWHQHPINQHRSEHGLPEINGLWLHGGGERTPLGPSSFASTVSDDPRVRAWARAAGLASEQLRGSDDLPPPVGDAVSLIPTLLSSYNAGDWTRWLHSAAELTAQWPALHARAQHAGFDLALQLFGANTSRTLLLSARDRWHFWRRGDAAAMLTDSDA